MLRNTTLPISTLVWEWQDHWASCRSRSTLRMWFFCHPHFQPASQSLTFPKDWDEKDWKWGNKRITFPKRRSRICKEASELGNSLALPPSLSQLVTYQLKILQIISGFKQPSMTALIQLLRLTARWEINHLRSLHIMKVVNLYADVHQEK